MKSVLEEIYCEIFENLESCGNKEERKPYGDETVKLLSQFKAILLTEQRDLFDKLWRSVSDGEYEAGLAQFKGGFKMGFALACECLKG